MDWLRAEAVLFDLARAGVVLGVVVEPVQPGSEAYRAVSIDTDGVLCCVRVGTKKAIVRWCMERRMLVCPSLGELVQTMRRGGCVGLLPDVAALVAEPL